MVDTTAGINTAVNRLRAALQDDAEKPTHIETVVGLGYRFIAEVRGSDEPDAEDVAPDNSEPSKASEPPAGPVGAEGATPSAAILENTTQLPEVVSELVPSQRTGPALARGRQLPAGALLLAPALLLLGLSVFLLRRPRDSRSGAGPPSTASFGFQQITLNDENNQVSASAISHNGAQLAYADASGVTIRTVGVGAERFLAVPEGVVVDRLAWFKGDQKVILSATDLTTRQPQIWSVGLDGAPARSVVESGADAIVSPSTSAILFTRVQRTELWIMNPGENTPRRVIVGKGENYLPLTWIGQTNFVVLRRCTLPNDVLSGSSRSQYQCTYAVLDVGRGTVFTTAQEFYANSASISPEGQLLFPDNQGEGVTAKTQLLSSNINVTTGELISQPTFAGTAWGFSSFSLSGSDDGKQLALVSRRRADDIYTADLRNGSLRGATKLLHPAPDNYPHSWSSDSRAVIYESTQSGRSWIYQQTPGDGPATLLARALDEGSLPQLTPDAKWILFESLPADPATHVKNAIFRIPQDGGKLENVPTHGRVDDFYCSVSRTGICVLRRTVDQQFVYYKLDPLQGEGEELARTERVESEFGDWSVSPDGRWIALPLHGPEDGGIRLVNLCGKARCTEQFIAVRDAGELLETTWAPDSKSFYVEAKREAGFALLRVDLGGKAELLTTSLASIWGVPSRDGKRLAFPAQTTSTNVWKIERRTTAP